VFEIHATTRYPCISVATIALSLLHRASSPPEATHAAAMLPPATATAMAGGLRAPRPGLRSPPPPVSWRALLPPAAVWRKKKGK
jgi:hypothetical protein